MRFLLVSLGVFASLLLSPAADARRTVIDAVVDPDDPDNLITTSLTLDGYCDFNGDDCQSYAILPFTVDFGNGPTDRLIVGGSGNLDFVGGTTPGIGDDGTGTIVGYDVLARITPGQSFLTEQDFQGSGATVYLQSAALQIASNGSVISARWFQCTSPQFCNLNQYGALLTRVAGGFNVLFNYGTIFPDTFVDPSAPGDPYLFGADTPDLDLQEASALPVDRSFAFFLPAAFSDDPVGPVDPIDPGVPVGAVPEPATWLTMLLGFAMIGGMLRRVSGPSVGRSGRHLPIKMGRI